MPILDPIIQMVIGLIPTMETCGYPITIGVGHLFIMEDGLITTVLDGFGYRVMNGVQLGYPGEKEVDIMDGRPWPQVFP